MPEDTHQTKTPAGLAAATGSAASMFVGVAFVFVALVCIMLGKGTEAIAAAIIHAAAVYDYHQN